MGNPQKKEKTVASGKVEAAVQANLDPNQQRLLEIDHVMLTSLVRNALRRDTAEVTDWYYA